MKMLNRGFALSVGAIVIAASALSAADAVDFCTGDNCAIASNQSNALSAASARWGMAFGRPLPSSGSASYTAYSTGSLAVGGTGTANPQIAYIDFGLRNVSTVDLQKWNLVISGVTKTRAQITVQSCATAWNMTTHTCSGSASWLTNANVANGTTTRTDVLTADAGLYLMATCTFTGTTNQTGSCAATFGTTVTSSAVASTQVRLPVINSI